MATGKADKGEAAGLDTPGETHTPRGVANGKRTT